jgi:hypothetical protein
MKPLVNLMDITTHVSHKIAVHWISVDQLERGDYKNVGAESEAGIPTAQIECHSRGNRTRC